MNRPIKFRAWDKEIKQWRDLEDYYFAESEREDRASKLAHYDESNIILMQFTGLLDKNGKEIYESDIVKFETMRNAEPHVITWHLGGFKAQNKSSEFEWLTLAHIFESDSRTIEVLGNIYENSELLK